MEKISAKDILITTAPPWGLASPPLGLAYLSEYLGSRGMDVGVVDFNLRCYRSLGPEHSLLWHVENKNYWSHPETFKIVLKLLHREMNSFVREISGCDAPVIGFSVVDPKERMTIELIKGIKAGEPKKKIILGGPATSTEEQRKIFVENISECIDAMVIGEGEGPLYELVKRVKAGKSLAGIPGTLVKNRGQWENTMRLDVPSLDALPHPTYDGFRLDEYLGKTLLVEWSRGCIGRCAFCKNWNLVKGFRSRSSRHIYNEFLYHREKNNISEFTVCDPMLNGKIETLREVCELILGSPYRFRWSGEITPRREMTEDIFRTMKKSGCFKLQIGLESASDRVLRLMRKSYTAEEAEDTIRRAHGAGISTEIFLLIGFPGEREKDFDETVKFIRKNRKHIDAIKSINTLHLIAGTDLHARPQDYHILPLPEKDWHYRWQTSDGNDYNTRKERAESILKLARDLDLRVLETNLHEGKEKNMEREAVSKGWTGIETQVNDIQKLNTDQRVKRKRNLSRLGYLLCLLIITLLADIYLLFLKKARKTIVFPGG